MNRRWAAAVVVSLMVTLGASPAAGQTEAVPGEVVSVPILLDGAITVDGDLSDWASLPAVETVDGPLPSADPDTVGRVRWQVAAANGQLFVAATITDDQIFAGLDGGNHWKEDSIELYVNFGDLGATTYGDDMAQIRISAVDRGNLEPDQLTITGVGDSNFDVTGFVFETPDGWGLEVAIPVPNRAPMESGGIFGFQIQANGSSGGDRDLKLNWSVKDVADTSFEDPSVFGQGVFAGADDSATAGVIDETDALPDPEDTAAVDPVTESESASAEVVPDTIPVEVQTPEQQQEERSRALLVAAVISAITVLVGGLWFENRRKKSEERAVVAAIGTGVAADDEANEDEEFEELLSSILDEDV